MAQDIQELLNKPKSTYRGVLEMILKYKGEWMETFTISAWYPEPIAWWTVMCACKRLHQAGLLDCSICQGRRNADGTPICGFEMDQRTKFRVVAGIRLESLVSTEPLLKAVSSKQPKALEKPTCQAQTTIVSEKTTEMTTSVTKPIQDDGRRRRFPTGTNRPVAPKRPNTKA